MRAFPYGCVVAVVMACSLLVLLCGMFVHVFCVFLVVVVFVVFLVVFVACCGCKFDVRGGVVVIMFLLSLL